MNSHRALVFAAAAASFALAAASAAPAQQPTTPQQPTAPQPTVTVPPSITVGKAPDVIVRQPKPKLDKYSGRVLAINVATIVVQSHENPRMVWSFQYSTDLHSKVADLIGSRGYQPGDKVTVYCNPGTTVAVKIKGKPSKSS